jgi:hypothetical protein
MRLAGLLTLRRGFVERFENLLVISLMILNEGIQELSWSLKTFIHETN